MAVTILNFPSSLPESWQILPQEIPTVAEDVIDESVYLEAVHLSATSGAATVTIADKQGSPIDVMKMEVSPLSPALFEPKQKRCCPGGFTWVASAAGIHAWVKWSK